MVVVSAGFHKTHMTTAAREAFVRGLLSVAVTGAYPTGRVRQLTGVTGTADRGRVARLLERGEAIDERSVRPLALPELAGDAALAFASLTGAGELAARAAASTWRWYGRRAARLLRPGGGRVLHFRAGFGHASIDRARELGMHVLCDHAIAHPALLGELVARRGRSARLEGQMEPATAGPLLPPTERAILEDIDRSDSVLVNSDFVKDTFLACGWPPERVHVIYLGVDDNFLAGAQGLARRAHPPSKRLRLLFAGRFEERKGADVLVEALQGLDTVDWELAIAGPILPDVRAAHRRFFEDPRVSPLGTLRRSQLAAEMAQAPVFVFPSYAEGSARAVFEALACGCYVITTANSGTIVEDGVHGALVPSDDPQALRSSILAADDDRGRLAEIGGRNAKLIAGHYQQRAYGDALASLYVKLSDRTVDGAPRALSGPPGRESGSPHRGRRPCRPTIARPRSRSRPR